MDQFFVPPIAVHPGKTLLETLEALRMTQADLSERTGLTTKTINEIVQGKNPITPETAIKLSAVFGMSSTFWNNLQRVYDVAIARGREAMMMQKETATLKLFSCFNELVKWNYIEKSKTVIDKVKNLLNFFGVSSLEYIEQTEAVAFRRSKMANISSYCLAAWLRCGEIDAKKVETKPFDQARLEKTLEYLRALTMKSPEVFGNEIVKTCADCGIAVVFTPHFNQTSVNGATRWLNSDTALIQLSLRYKWSDIFWFTFFHEIGHIFKHGKKDRFVEFGKSDTDKELEADMFAKDILIPKGKYEDFYKKGSFTFDSIINFADQIGISPAIVAGRLSHDTGNWKKFIGLRDKLEFKRN